MMSEEKFALQTVGDTVVRNNQTNEIYWNYNLVHLINSLSKENEQLKFENETLKSNYQREIQSSIDFCNAYSKTNGELLEKIEKLEKENEQLRQFISKGRRLSVKELMNNANENELLKKKIRELEKILADDIVSRYEIKEAWKQRTEKRWNDE